MLLTFWQNPWETLFVELILYLLAFKFTQKELLRRYFQQVKYIIWQFLIFHDLDLFRQNVEVCFFKIWFWHWIEFAKWNSKNENAEIRIPLQSILSLERKIFETENYRSSHRRCSAKKGVLKNFANFKGKHLCWGLLLIKLQSWRTTTLLKRDSNTDVSYDICQNFKNIYFEEHLSNLM